MLKNGAGLNLQKMMLNKFENKFNLSSIAPFDILKTMDNGLNSFSESTLSNISVLR